MKIALAIYLPLGVLSRSLTPPPIDFSSDIVRVDRRMLEEDGDICKNETEQLYKENSVLAFDAHADCGTSNTCYVDARWEPEYEAKVSACHNELDSHIVEFTWRCSVYIFTTGDTLDFTAENYPVCMASECSGDSLLDFLEFFVDGLTSQPGSSWDCHIDDVQFERNGTAIHDGQIGGSSSSAWSVPLLLSLMLPSLFALVM